MTDKSTYMVGEDIAITIQAYNSSSTAEILSFTSTQQFDYSFNGTYRWAADKAFALVFTM